MILDIEYWIQDTGCILDTGYRLESNSKDKDTDYRTENLGAGFWVQNSR